jgi:hypothetical protein
VTVYGHRFAKICGRSATLRTLGATAAAALDRSFGSCYLCAFFLLAFSGVSLYAAAAAMELHGWKSRSTGSTQNWAVTVQRATQHAPSAWDRPQRHRQDMVSPRSMVSSQHGKALPDVTHGYYAFTEPWTQWNRMDHVTDCRQCCSTKYMHVGGRELMQVCALHLQHGVRCTRCCVIAAMNSCLLLKRKNTPHCGPGILLWSSVG